MCKNKFTEWLGYANLCKLIGYKICLTNFYLLLLRLEIAALHMNSCFVNMRINVR